MSAEAREREPAYVRAQEEVMRLVREEGLAPGTRVPSERALALKLGLSRMTVRQGIENLVRAGVLERRSTNGTCVAAVSVMRVVDSRRAFSMSQMIRRSGARPGSQLLVFAPGPADRRVAASLEIEPGTPVLMIRRLRTANELPLCVETSQLPRALVPDLVAEDLANNASLYELLRERFGRNPADRESEIRVGPISAEDARLLDLPEGLNVLLYNSVVRDSTGVRIECVASVNHPERVVFSTDAVHVI